MTPAVKANGYTPKRLKAHRRRVAWHADRARRADGDPSAQLNAAIDHLKSAVRHTSIPDRQVRALVTDTVEHVRAFAAETGMPSGSVAHNEQALAEAASTYNRMSVTLRWLWAAVRRLPEGERQRAAVHYAQQLAAEARRLPQHGTQ